MPDRKKILVVDDEADARKMICRRLVTNEYQVYETGNPVEGFELVKKVKPDLILLDIMMPELDGLKFYQRLREEAGVNAIPVIFITALSQQITMDRRSLELIAHGKYGMELDDNYLVIGKPYEPEDLMVEIRRIFSNGGRVLKR
ncbi:MAG: response regulator [Candidatus Omnitrophica bacterium]|nr:response regulator [Candidatus Omnitrophota bacterium]